MPWNEHLPKWQRRRNYRSFEINLYNRNIRQIAVLNLKMSRLDVERKQQQAV